MVQPWRVLSSEPVIADRWIDLRADRCVTPAGIEIAPYYVLTYPDWVHIVAITPADELVLVEQYRHGAGATCLEIPGGAIDAADTDPIAAGRRELLEETGFAAESWQRVSALYANPANQTNRVHTVLASGARRVAAPRLEDGEVGMTVQCRPITEILAGIGSGLLSQSMQVSAVLLALSAAGRIRL
jgi:ADP-ribose pyrophosphatase YjhB (NUDIX family)